MPRPGIDKYRDVYKPDDIPSSKPPPEHSHKKFFRAAALVLLAILLIGGPVYYYVSQRGVAWFSSDEDAIQVEQGKEIVAVRQLVKEGKLVRALDVI